MAAQKSYSEKDIAAVVGIWDELHEWGSARRLARFGKAPISANAVFTLAVERGLKLSVTGRPWTYSTVLRALQRSGKVPLPPSEGGPGEKRAWVRASDSANKPASKPAGVTPGSPDVLFSFLERDLGDFLRPEDRARAQRAIDEDTQRKIADLMAELGEKTEIRIKLQMYGAVYDRLIARLTHRIDLLRAKGVDPDVEDRIEADEDRQDAADAIAAAAPVTPILPSPISAITERRVRKGR